MGGSVVIKKHHQDIEAGRIVFIPGKIKRNETVMLFFSLRQGRKNFFPVGIQFPGRPGDRGGRSGKFICQKFPQVLRIFILAPDGEKILVVPGICQAFFLIIPQKQKKEIFLFQRVMPGGGRIMLAAADTKRRVIKKFLLLCGKMMEERKKADAVSVPVKGGDPPVLIHKIPGGEGE